MKTCVRTRVFEFSPAGRAEKWAARQSWIVFSRPFGTESWFMMYPGLASWAKFSRPCGTEFGNGVHTTPSRPD